MPQLSHGGTLPKKRQWTNRGKEDQREIEKESEMKMESATGIAVGAREIYSFFFSWKTIFFLLTGLIILVQWVKF